MKTNHKANASNQQSDILVIGLWVTLILVSFGDKLPVISRLKLFPKVESLTAVTDKPFGFFALVILPATVFVVRELSAVIQFIRSSEKVRPSADLESVTDKV